MKPSEDPPAALRWEIALDTGDQQDQHAKQHQDFDRIIDEELDTFPDAAFHIQAGQRQKGSYQAVQPFHPQDLILNEIPDHEQQHPPSSLQAIRIDSI